MPLTCGTLVWLLNEWASWSIVNPEERRKRKKHYREKSNEFSLEIDPRPLCSLELLSCDERDFIFRFLLFWGFNLSVLILVTHWGERTGFLTCGFGLSRGEGVQYCLILAGGTFCPLSLEVAGTFLTVVLLSFLPLLILMGKKSWMCWETNLKNIHVEIYLICKTFKNRLFAKKSV